MTPEDWLRECPFGRWIRFDSIPEDLFEDVFALIDGKYLGYLYFFDDFDLAFKKDLFLKVTHYELMKEKTEQTRERHRKKVRENYLKRKESKRGGSG